MTMAMEIPLTLLNAVLLLIRVARRRVGDPLDALVVVVLGRGALLGVLAVCFES